MSFPNANPSERKNSESLHSINRMMKRPSFVVITALILAVVYILKREHLNDVQSSIKTNFQFPLREFNKDKNDVLSFLHIQKTGGTTMERHLVSNIKNSNCKCDETKPTSCSCYRENSDEIWLICRYIKPTWPCGLHPDFETLRECSAHFINTLYVPRKRRYFFATMLRDPFYRLLSEFRHVQRGGLWKKAASLCQGELLSLQVPHCFYGASWVNVSLNKFLSCPYNLAFNRQTWMLANISQISCDPATVYADYDLSLQLLNSAKRNLASIAYFGLLEYPVESQFVFEKTFNLEFIEPFQHWETSFSQEYLKTFNMTENQEKRINKVTGLDRKLYKFAKEILFKRYTHFVSKYGMPMYDPPPKNGRFNLRSVKVDRMKFNINVKLPKRLKKKLGRSILPTEMMKVTTILNKHI